MGILFSRPTHDASVLSLALYGAGNASSASSATIAPYLGINTGSYDGVSADKLPPIPLEWIISPSHPGGSCPDGSSILAWFGAAEAVVAVLQVVAAYRPFIHRISGGYLGNRIKNSVWLTWTITFACQLLANAIAAAMVGHTAGYTHLNMLHIFTVYMSRPRFYPIILALLRSLYLVRRPRKWAKTTIIQQSVDDRYEFPYTDAWITTAMSELLLLVVSAIFTGVTWHRLPASSGTREYISDHVSLVESAPGILLLCMLSFVPIYKRYGEAFPIEGRRYENGRHWGASIGADGTARVRIKKDTKQATAKRWASAVASAVLLGYVTLTQWAYWTRFVSMTGVL